MIKWIIPKVLNIFPQNTYSICFINYCSSTGLVPLASLYNSLSRSMGCVSHDLSSHPFSPSLFCSELHVSHVVHWEWQCFINTTSYIYPLYELVWQFSLSSVAQLCPTLCDSMKRSMPGLPVHHQLLESTQTHVHRVGDAIQPSHPLSSPLLLPSIFPSIRIFSNESALCFRWPKFWSFSFNISPSNEHSGLISFRMDWLDLLAVQGTLKSLLQHHSSKASILRCSAFFVV